jgi:hypothetical protein
MSTQRQRIDYSGVKTTHLHPLFNLADCLQVPGHRCRVDQVVCQQLHAATTTRGASVIGVERMGSASWISGERTTTSRVASGGTVASSPPVATAASSAASSIGSGAPSAASDTRGVKFCIGTAAGMSLPSASAPVKKKTSASATTTTLWEYYTLSRVLTFDHAGFGQCSSSSRRFRLRLGGRSGLLGGRHGFFLCHRRRGLIPLPGKIC